jgi:ABC-type Fe3+ transport system substrate-binding protein
MIDDSGIVVWLGSYTGVLVYNAKLVPPEKAPKSWEACTDPYFNGKFSVDTKPNVLAWLTPAWGAEKLLGFARRIKEKQSALEQGQYPQPDDVDFGRDQHELRQLRALDAACLEPGSNLKMVVPDPFPVSFHEPEAIYAGAKNIHSALLWIEFIASKEGQQVAESLEPGRGSFLIEGTLTNKLMKGAKVSLCGDACRGTEDKLMERIATEAWGFPKVGYEPKK